MEKKNKTYVAKALCWESKSYSKGDEIEVTDKMLTVFGEDYFTKSAWGTETFAQEQQQLKEQGAWLELKNAIERGDTDEEIFTTFGWEALQILADEYNVEIDREDAKSAVDEIRGLISKNKVKDLMSDDEDEDGGEDTDTDTDAKDTVDVDAMNKKELIAYAEANEIQLPAGAKKAEILAIIKVWEGTSGDDEDEE